MKIRSAFYQHDRTNRATHQLTTTVMGSQRNITATPMNLWPNTDTWRLKVELHNTDV